MDDKAFEELLANVQAAPEGVPAAQPSAPGQPTPPPQSSGGLELDPEAANQALGSLAETFGAELGITQNPDGSFNLPDQAPDDSLAREENRLGSATMVAPITGGLKSTFETKDFLFGDTPADQQSTARRFVEEADAAIKDASPIIGGLASGIGQFTVAMVGLGKLGMAAKALPWVGRGAAAVEGLKGGSVALESGKAALAGAIAFDPHEERLSNLIQDTPLANPINEWLAAKPDDSAAFGRVKNAMESIGLDAAIIGTFKAGVGVWKYLKAGDAAGAERVLSEFEHERAAHDTPPSAGNEPELPAELKVDPEAAPIAPAAAGKPESPTRADTAPAVEAEAVPAPETDKLSGFQPIVTVLPDEVKTLVDELPTSLENADKDWETLAKFGTWKAALEKDQKLAPELSGLYDRINTTGEFGQFMDLAVNRKLEELKANGFRDVVSDEKLSGQVARFADLVGDDPSTVLGQLQAAGEAAGERTARMLTLGSLSAKAFQDASVLAERYKWGDYSKFGSKEGMEAEINKRVDIALTTLKMADEVRSEAGRALRALRGRPFDPALFEGLRNDPLARDRFYELLSQSGGDPKKLKFLAEPGLIGRLADTALYIRVNGLLSGYTTQFVNLLGNGYMLGVRPLERILGAVPLSAAGGDIGAEARGIMKESLKQYAYMGTALRDGFGMAVKAFVENDGVLKRNAAELVDATGGQRWKVPGTQALDQNYFRPLKSVPDLIHNAVSVPLTAVGLPTRALGGIDELVKQTVYRSKLAARAHVDATERALTAGLKGEGAQRFVAAEVRKTLDDAFDAEGRGLDRNALREADIATFQQDLLPRSIGRGVQSMVSNDDSRMLRLVLPFVKTPVNVLRYGWKMTPGLNMLQREYRDMAWGRMGREAQAQAVGQMSMGALFMGAAAFLSSQGLVTGGGPSDPKLKANLMATGWRPYSFVKQKPDGSNTYIPFNRYDPVGLPFGIIADIQDARELLGDDAETSAEADAALGGLLMSLAKQFTSRTYLLGLNQALDALSDPDANLERYAGDLAATFVPFSSATRQLSSDPYMRDARSVTDKLLRAVPGLGEGLPPRYDWLGQPVVNRQGLWTDDNGTVVDREVQRLSLIHGGSALNPPAPSFGNKVDLRDITLTTGENAYVEYQRLAGRPSPKVKPLRSIVANTIRTAAYQNAPDGDSDTKGTKLWLLRQVVNKYRDAAGKLIRADKNVRDALMASQRKVVDHYKHLKQPPTPASATDSKAGLQPILEGFGASSK